MAEYEKELSRDWALPVGMEDKSIQVRAAYGAGAVALLHAIGRRMREMLESGEMDPWVNEIVFNHCRELLDQVSKFSDQLRKENKA